MKRHVLSTALAATAAALALGLAGCSSGTSAETADASDGIRIVASTNVYGSLAEAVGGDFASVTSIIDSPDKDPHEYQADGQNQLSLSKAQIVIENGGGYDDFVDTMLSAADNSEVTVLNVADISGYDQEPASGEFNEHLWYDFPTMQKLVDSLVTELSALDAGDASVFQANGESVKAQLATLEAAETDIKATYSGSGVAITEPVPLYLLEAAGLDNRTPDAFSEAIEGDTDVPPTVLQEALALFDSHAVKLLVYNEQTGGPQTDAVIEAAKKNGIPAVGVTETLPDGVDYFGWMKANLDAVSAALGQ
ncbi:metal ABC transporter solute-binding protein, Zn/Mn family [Herbiconiux ginsengi]|uniref:Zinc/manganese transport system substrate-binding protein n=1 Tax=Herbiconiux ginsengi TaxID=381665 RepID=A0A1H3MA17_9MICO|nr:zinc ABC transporter substrate-binding protein [Herbiconiux ginsengi]SDY73423.1 zinc/manganese transport system substrate-binding protein [Herbiconiux ginsengi]